MGWKLLDVTKLFEDGMAGAGMAGATTSANVGTIPLPLGGMQRPAWGSSKSYEVAPSELERMFPSAPKKKKSKKS